MSDALARLLAGLDRSITAWSAQPAQVLSDHALGEPHVVVLEVAEIPGVAERAQEIRARWPQARIVLVVPDDSATWSQVASAIRASGCVSSRLGPAALMLAVTGAPGNGGLGAGRTARAQAHQQMPTSDLERTLARLTAREAEVLRHLVAGLSADLIAARLGVSANTVRSHLQAVLSKLGVHSRLQAVAFAHRAGLDGDRSWLLKEGSPSVAETAH